MNYLDHIADAAGIAIEERLGSGMGRSVFRVTRSGEDYALKVPVEPNPSSEMEDRFFTEATALARMDHPLLPKAWTVGCVEQMPYLVVDLVQGRPLSEWLEQSPLDVQTTIRIFQDLLRTLAVVHGHDYLHRDIRPDNILWNRRQARLVDFGFVVETSRATEALGTVAYAAPEQTGMLDRPVGRRADLYSLGAVIYHCLTGRPPFQVDTDQQMLEMHVSSLPDPPDSIVTDVPASLSEVLMTMLATDPDSRYPDITSAWMALADATSDWGKTADSGSRLPDGITRQREAFPQRHTHLDDLRQQWSAIVESGRGALSLLRGKPGSGRSLVVDSHLSETSEKTQFVARISASWTNSAPLAPIRALSRRLLGLESLDADDIGPRLEQLGLDPADHQHAIHLLAQTEDDEERDSDLADIVRLFVDTADHSNITQFVVEHFPRLDTASRKLLHRLATHLDEAPIQLLVTSGSLDEPDPATEMLLNLVEPNRLRPANSNNSPTNEPSGSPTHQTLVLEPLNRSETAEFVRRYLGRPIGDDSLIDTIYNRTDGNPVHIKESLALALDKHQLVPDWSGWFVRRSGAGESQNLGDGINGVLQQRFAALPNDVQTTCKIASLWGDDVPVDVLFEAIPASEDTIEEHLRIARDHGLVARTQLPDNSQPPRDAISFRDDTFRTFLRRQLQQSDDLTDHHQQLAEAAHKLEADPYLTGIHFARGDNSDPESGWRACLQAGQHAASVNAYGEAVELFDAAEGFADALNRPLPQDFLFSYGKALIQQGHLVAGRRRLEEAIDRADTPTTRAHYQAALNESFFSGFQLSELDNGAREILTILGEPTPTTTIGLATRISTMTARYNWWRLRGAPTASTKTRRKRCRILTQAYDQLAMVAVNGGHPTLIIYTQLGRLLSAMPLGPSFELALAESAFGFSLMMMGFRNAGRNVLDRARTTAESSGSDRAGLRVDVADAWFDHLDGHPERSAQTLSRLLKSRADQLSFADRNLSIQDLVWNFAYRGKSEHVVYWYERWQRQNRLDAADTGLRPSIIYPTVLWHARLLGRDDLAEDLRSKSRSVVEQTNESTVCEAHHTGVALDELLDGRTEAALERIDWLAEQREAPPLLWTKAFFIVQALIHCVGFEKDAISLADYRERVDDLADAEQGHPTVKSHLRLHQGRLALTSDQHEQTAQYFGDAERLAEHFDIPWIGCLVARYRAHWLDERAKPITERTNARDSVRRAARLGWTPFAQRLADEFDLPGHLAYETEDDTEQTATSGSNRSLSKLQLRRQVDALLEVSLSTSNVLEPDRVTTIALETAIGTLGADRAILFTKTDDDTLEYTAVQTTRDDEALSDANNQTSRRIASDVLSTGRSYLSTSVAADNSLSPTGSESEPIRSAVAVPIHPQETITGVLYLDNHLARGVFSPEDVEVLQAIANQLGAVLATTRSAQLEIEVESERKQRAYAERLRSFTERVNSSLDIDEVLEALMDELRRLLRVDAAAVAIRDTTPIDHDDPHEPPEAHWSIYGAALDTERLGHLQTHLEQDSPTWVDQSTDPTHSPFSRDDISCWLLSPLHASSERVGLVALGSTESHAFSSTDVEQAQTFIGQAGLGLAKIRLATLDDLTGIYNRRKLVDLASHEMRRAERHPEPFSVVLFDLDDFKSINDQHGHTAGDRVLHKVASAAQQAVRDTDILGRYGGEEFAVALPSTDLEAARSEVAERLRRRFESLQFEFDGEQVGVTASFGVASRRQGETDLESLLDRADAALYAAKAAGKNCIETRSDDVDDTATGA